MPKTNESTNTAIIPETLPSAKVSMTLDTTETLDSPDAPEILMTPETSNPHKTLKIPESPKTTQDPRDPKNLETLGHVNTATEWLNSQGVKTPQRGSQISASSSRPITAESHSTDEEGADIDGARQEPIVPVQSEEAVERGAAAAEQILPPPAPPASAVDTGVPPANDSVVAMIIDESDIQPIPPSSEPQASESAEIPPSAVEKGKAKEDEKVESPQVITIQELDELRSAICESLINRSLDVLRVHSTVTFELSSLLTSTFGKVSDSSDVRKEVPQQYCNH